MNYYKLLREILMFLTIGIITSIFSHFVIEMYYYNHNYEHVKNLILEGRPELFLMGTIILFIIYTLITSLIGSSVMGGIILVLISWIFGIATYYKSIFRSEPLYPNELYMIREPMFLLEMVDTKTAILMIASIIITLIFLIGFYKYVIAPKQKSKKSNNQYLLRGILLLFSVGLIIYIGRFNHPGNKVKEKYNNYASWALYNQNKNYSNNGFIAGFLSNLSAPPMEKVSNYSKKSIESLYEKYNNVAKKMNKDRKNESTDTNIIFVMNESFSDPLNLEGIESNKDPLTNYREIVEESLSGSILSPSIGGGTATNEFQVLTGLSMEPFAPQLTSPFIQLTNQTESLPVITNRMRGFDFQNSAIHPYTPTFYRRNDVYKDFNFDEFRHQENMLNREQISSKHRYISDFSAYQEVFDVLEKTEKRDFIHLVTIQNHMPFANKYDVVDYEISGSGNDEEASAYFKDLENSDISLRLFINKIDSFDEPILLVFWGDHLPGFYSGEVLENNDYQKMRETPFLIYSNQMELTDQVDMISPIFLSNHVLEILNLKVTPFEALLYSLQDKMPFFDDQVYYDNFDQELKNNRESLSTEALQLLEDYSLLMYDITTGHKHAEKIGFFGQYTSE